MNRKLVLIISDGGNGANHLKGVHIDENNYLNFFKSPEGGAWMDHEILVYDQNNFDVGVLHAIDLGARAENNPIGYYLIVFCGHGYTDELGRIHLEVRTDCDLLLENLQAAVARSRYLIIADSCRAVVRLNEGGQVNALRMFSTSEDARRSVYAALCRNWYNAQLGQAPRNMHMVLFSNSFNETAEEDSRNGGYYSYALMQSAKEKIEEAHRLQERKAISCSNSVDDIHHLAEEKVRTQSHDTQHPEILENSRSLNRFPFVVVPHWQMQLGDE